MMDYFRRVRATGRQSLRRFHASGSDDIGRRLSRRLAAEVESLERRELLSTVQNFDVAGTGTRMRPSNSAPDRERPSSRAAPPDPSFK